MLLEKEDLLAAVSARLEEATTAVQACEIAVAELGRHTDAMISVLLRGRDNLRCVAATGSRRVFASLPAGAGVAGRVYATGRAETITAVESDPDYIPTRPGVALEICAPIRDFRDRPIGTINLEWTERVDAARWRETVERVAERLGARLAQLGGAPTETYAERLLRHAMGLTSAASEEQLAAAVLDAASEVAGLATAVLVLVGPDGPRLSTPAGCPTKLARRLRERLRAAGPAALTRLVRRAQRHGPTYTLGRLDRPVPRDQELLVAAGVRTLLSVPLGAVDAGGLLLLADERVTRLDPTTINLVELLVAHAGTCLDRLRTLRRLHEQAMCDPLTGLRHHGPFAERMTSAVPGRTALIAIDVDDFKAVNDTYGHQVGDRVLVRLARALQKALRHGDELYRIGGDEFVAVVEVLHAEEALAIGERLTRAARRVGRTVSVGVAVQRPGETPEGTLRRADVALYAVKRAGRNGVRLASPA